MAESMRVTHASLLCETRIGCSTLALRRDLAPHEFVRIWALIAVSADGRRDCPDSGVSIGYGAGDDSQSLLSRATMIIRWRHSFPSGIPKRCTACPDFNPVCNA